MRSFAPEHGTRFCKSVLNKPSFNLHTPLFTDDCVQSQWGALNVML